MVSLVIEYQTTLIIFFCIKEIYYNLRALPCKTGLYKQESSKISNCSLV